MLGAECRRLGISCWISICGETDKFNIYFVSYFVMNLNYYFLNIYTGDGSPTGSTYLTVLKNK